MVVIVVVVVRFIVISVVGFSPPIWIIGYKQKMANSKFLNVTDVVVVLFRSPSLPLSTWRNFPPIQ